MSLVSPQHPGHVWTMLWIVGNLGETGGPRPVPASSHSPGALDKLAGLVCEEPRRKTQSTESDSLHRSSEKGGVTKAGLLETGPMSAAPLCSVGFLCWATQCMQRSHSLQKQTVWSWWKWGKMEGAGRGELGTGETTAGYVGSV